MADAPKQGPGRPAGSSAPKDETPEDRFRRVAGRRMGNALEALDRVKSCASRSTYAYTEEQVEKIMEALETSMNEIEEAFKTGATGEKPAFAL